MKHANLREFWPHSIVQYQSVTSEDLEEAMDLDIPTGKWFFDASWLGREIDREMPEDKCESCGTTHQVDMCINPYIQEIDGDQVDAFLCPGCYGAYCDEV